MITIFTEISQLDAALDIALLSKQGTKLYGQNSSGMLNSQQRADVWLALLNHLNKPQTAQFVFSTGIFFVCLTHLGYLIVAVKEANRLEDVRTRCIALQAKLRDSSIQKKTLLELLGRVDDSLKPAILEELMPFADKEVARSVLPLLAEYDRVEEDCQTELVLAILQILGECSIFEAIKPLKRFLERYSSQTEAVDTLIINAAKVSIMQLELSSLSDDGQNTAQEFEGTLSNESVGSEDSLLEENIAERTTAKNIKEKSGIKKGDQTHSAPVDKAKQGEDATASEEKRVRKLLETGRKKEAVAIIMKYIEAAAKQKMFDKAECLREKLIEIDSMMLTEIIRAAEIIEEEKIASILPEHLEIWEALIQHLSEDEFSALYHSMSLVHYKNGESIIQQGDFFSKLIFVNSGELQLSAKVKNQEVFLTKVEAGQVLEGGSFFEASVWTISVKSLGAELFLLSRNQLEKLSENYPSMENKLSDFCAQFSSPSKLIERYKRNRRKCDRKSLSSRVAVTLLDKNGREKAVNFKGDLFDISQGGLAFSIRSSRKKNAHMLFGQKIRLALLSGNANQTSGNEFTGKIVAVRGHHVVSNEYSIHVEFDGEISLKQFENVVGMRTS